MNGSATPAASSDKSVARNDMAPSRPWSSLPAAFAQVVHTRPGKIAVVQGTRSWTYADLDRLSDVAAALLQEKGVVRGGCVGIFMDRSTEAVVAMLAILKLGAAYVPCDPAAPGLRLAAQAKAASIRVLAVASAAEIPTWHEGEAVVIDASSTISTEPPRELDLHPLELAYVIHTSGSTNEAKGVCIPHRAVLDLVHGAHYCRFAPDDVVYHGMSIAFDGSTFEIWGALLSGATLVIAPSRISADEIADLVEAHRVTVLMLSTGVFNSLDRETLRRLRTVRVLLAGGDVMSPIVANQFLASGGRTVVNGYGPTEVTTFSHCYAMTSATVDGPPIPIGPPLPGTAAYVLDDELEPRPLHTEGELFIAGTGLAQGYLGNPALTAERFVPDPFAGDGTRMYRTGDLVSQAPDGCLDYVGRIDTQVKIRGFRVELGEIETCLRAAGALTDACVIHVRNESGASSLHAYVVPDQGTACDTETALLDRLRAQLPDYMIPRRVVFLDALPLTINGKVDRKKLAGEAAAALDAAIGAAAPIDASEDALERALLDTLKHLLGQPQLMASENFFDVGGDSLTAMRFCATVGEQHRVSLPMSALFETDSLEQLIARVRSLKRSEASRVESF